MLGTEADGSQNVLAPNSPVTQISLFQDLPPPKAKVASEYSKVAHFDISQVRGSRMKKGKIIKDLAKDELKEKI